MTKYKEIIGGTAKDAENKFPWLKAADFQDAVIDIRASYLIWEDGVWKSGRWQKGMKKFDDFQKSLPVKDVRND